MKMTLKKRGFDFLYRDGKPIFSPVYRIDSYNIEDLQDLWQYLPYAMRLYFDALAHTSNVEQMPDDEKLDALIVWTETRDTVLKLGTLPIGFDFDFEDQRQKALSGAYLYRVGYRMFRTKLHSEYDGYELPTDRDFLVSRRVNIVTETGNQMYRYDCLYKVDMDSPETNASLHDVMTAAEVSEVYGIDAGTIRVSIHKGYIPARKSGGTWLVARTDAEQRWG
jgi:hypothetical protein